MTTSLISFDAFVERLLKLRERLIRIPRTNSTDSWPDGFPSPAALGEVLRSAFYGSLEQYEGRPIRTALTWTHPAYGRSFVHKLSASSNDFSQKAMRQLAQVADGSTTELGLILIEDRLEILGIEFCWPIRSAIRNDGFFPGVKISIKGPGHVEYQEGGIAIAYSRGRMQRLRPLQQNGVVRAWIEESQVALTKNAISSLKRDPVWGQHEVEPKFPQDIMLSFLCSMLRTIENRGHGGTLIILPRSSENAYIDIRFPASTNDLDRVINRFGEASILIAKHEYSSLLTPAFISEGNMFSDLQSYGVAFANLANCDGAVVMTRDAQLLGFGGIIQAPAARPQSTPFAKSRGARHTSAQWLCESVSGAIAFVVSADRGITVIHGVDGVANAVTDHVVW